MKVVRSIGLSFALAMAASSAAGAAPDISGTYWATSYSPNIQVTGGGDPPLNAAGKAAYEMNQEVRVIVMDKPLPPPQSMIVDPKYNVHSVGHWDGDTLVVESAGFNDWTFLDASGLPHSDEMTTVERFRKISDQLEDVITIHDPAMY